MTKQFSRPSANILLEAAELQERKGQDYNNATSSVEQADYYPRGVWSILDVVPGHSCGPRARDGRRCPR